MLHSEDEATKMLDFSKRMLQKLEPSVKNFSQSD